MKLMWIAGLLLLLQPVDHPDNLRINHHGQTIDIVKHADYVLPGSSMIDMVKFRQLLDDLDRQIYQAPVNAKIGNQEQNIPEQTGYKLNRKAFMEQFFDYYFGSGPSIIEVPRLAIHANVDIELLANIREKSIGHYSTYFNANNKNRSHNIALAAKTINNHVVFPGDTFSFNQIVGKRTTEKGYLLASVIVRGELSEGIGGGICQVSSTLFNSVDRAGLKIIRRYSHSRNVPYVPPGRDATVSWDGPDFTFQNQYNQPILIRSTAGAGIVIVTLYSSHVIEYKPREVPSAAKRLPEEISIKTDANHLSTSEKNK
jgi:vancomycin resistance protein YoaR